MVNEEPEEVEQEIEYIRISKSLRQEGVYIDAKFPDTLTIADALGMLEFAKMSLIQQFQDKESNS